MDRMKRSTAVVAVPIFLSIFKDDEVVFGEVGNVVAGFVCDCRDHIDQRNINLQLSGEDRENEEGKKQA